MASSTGKYRLLAWLGLLLVAGFLTTSIASYMVSRNAIYSSIKEQALPLSSDNIYSEIQKDMLRPVFISSLMAHDTFVRDWILDGEKDTAQIVRYLKEVKQKYGTVSSFLVSEKSRQYYYADGALKQIKEGEPRDVWYFRVRSMKDAFETNIDIDMANRDTMTVFINHRVEDYAGKFIGVTGVGLTLDTMATIIDSYQQRFKRNIYFVDAQGEIKLTGKSMKEVKGSIRQLPGISAIATDILNHSKTPTQLDYRHDEATMLVSSRFLPEMGWYLIVEQDITDEVRPVQQVFMMNLGISAVITLLVLAMTLLAVNRYQQRLEKAAGTDSLTGLLNRQAFEIVFQQSVREAHRSGRPLCAILFDLDLFKQVNDMHGHLNGDRILQAIAAITRAVIRESDIATRWGGEEFLVLLKDCPQGQALEIAEKLRNRIASHEFAIASENLSVTVSIGVAEYAYPETPDGFFTRTDDALYRAKEAGRNRIVAADILKGAGT